jgi:hypothetical protein
MPQCLHANSVGINYLSFSQQNEYNEARHSLTLKDITDLDKIDEALLRYLLGCHSKTPVEFIFLESGSIPIR